VSTTDLARVASQLLKVELLIAKIQFKAQSRRALLAYFALSLALLGIIMLNVAAYQWLKLQYGPVGAPLVVALANLLLAGLVAAMAWGVHARPELVAAQELRGLLVTELDSAMTRGATPSPVPSPLDFRSAQTIIPIAIALIRLLRRRRKTAETP
jgi:hypothetical protein